MKGALGDMMRKAQEMQAQMQKQQEEMKLLEITGEAGAGMVKVTLNGSHEAKKVQIDPAVMSGDADDREMLEDLVAAAINDATHKLAQEMQGKMADITSGMQLPPGFKMPF